MLLMGELQLDFFFGGRGVEIFELLLMLLPYVFVGELQLWLGGLNEFGVSSEIIRTGNSSSYIGHCCCCDIFAKFICDWNIQCQQFLLSPMWRMQPLWISFFLLLYCALHMISWRCAFWCLSFCCDYTGSCKHCSRPFFDQLKLKLLLRLTANVSAFCCCVFESDFWRRFFAEFKVWLVSSLPIIAVRNLS